MLSSFIRNANVRRKGKKEKLAVPPPQALSPVSPASFASPGVFDINERSIDLQPQEETDFEQQESFTEPSLPPTPIPKTDVITPRVQLELSQEPLSDWFQDFLDASGNASASEGGLSGSKTSGLAAHATASKDTHASDHAGHSWQGTNPIDEKEDDVLNVPNGHNLNDIISRNGPFGLKKFVPAPILIPHAGPTAANLQITHSASTAGPATKPTASLAVGATSVSHQPSPISSEDISAVSGTTLARALIANSFILSSGDHRSSRYRSGMTRQDSATLPRGDQPLINSPYWRDRRISGGEIVLVSETGRESPIPPVPPVPTVGMMFLDQTQGCRVSRSADMSQRHSDSDLKRKTSISSNSSDPRSTSQYVTSTELPSHTAALRRISRISEAPSPASTTPRSPQSALDQPSKSSISINEQSLLVTMRESEDSIRPYTASEIPTTASSRRTIDTSTSSPRPFQSGLVSPSPTDHSLDDYVFMAPGPPQSATSLGSESSASFVSQIRSKRSDSSLNKRKTGKIAGTMVHSAGGRSYIEFNRSTSSHISSQRNKKQVKLLPIGEPPQSLLVPQTPITPAIIASAAPSTYSNLSNFPLVPSSAVPAGTLEMPLTSKEHLDNVMVPVTTGIFARQRLGGVPKRLDFSQDPYGLTGYNIAVSPESRSSSNYTPSGSSAGYQTFPETPVAFTPLWSPDMSRPMVPPLPRHINESTHSRDGVRQVPRSATIPGPHELAKMQAGNPYASLSRSMTLGLPKREEPSLSNNTVLPRRPLSVLSPCVDEPQNIPLPSSSSGSSDSSPPSPISPGHRRAGSYNAAWPVSPAKPSPLSHVSVLHESSHEDQPPHSFIPALASPVSSTDASTDDPSLVNNGINGSRCLSPTSIPLPESKSTSPLLPFSNRSGSISPCLSSSKPDTAYGRPQPSTESLHTTAERQDVQEYSLPNTSLAAPPHPQSFLPSALPSPAPSSPVSSRSTTPPSPATSSPSFTPSFVAPPPYQAVVSNVREHSPVPPAFHATSPSASPPRAIQVEPAYTLPRERQASVGSLARNRVRSRPPLPIGPRKPSGPAQALGSFVAGRDRTGSVSSVCSNSVGGRAANSSQWQKLYSAASAPPLKFQVPPPKWRGLTLDAAQWTLTSNQLQATVSRAIKQSAEASSIRLLPLDILDNDIPEEMHRLEMRRTDIKSRYKILVRKRWNLMGSLAGHIDDGDSSETGSAIRTMEELSEVSANLDHLMDELHSVMEQIAQLKSLRDVHSASALAMALRKLNTSFLKHATEAQALRQQIESLEAERDEAWKQAEDVAQDFDELNDRVVSSVDVQTPDSEKGKDLSSRRSLRVLARRKSSVRVTKAGLRNPSRHRSQRSSVSSAGTRASLTVPTSSAMRSSYSEDIPPVPPLPLHKVTSLFPSALSGRSSMGLSSSNSASSGIRALAQAQKELYEMLGISMHDVISEGPSRPRSLSDAFSSKHASMHLRPLSDIGGAIRPDLQGNRTIHGALSNERRTMLAALGIMTD
ncbi:hypothetical protein BJ138DRAFT_1140777 [Hygrophoropsis aurantiaca]|uniref:Uncharacterized protein n=1 Tax=Hygrophoropsis aurantiaca TaxID=72124 RepID=A0ACB8ASC8_9AGAM|nr:hypothetical protein BJ138DRAFT_1140777 [Hygrophoropsis aurantiaca]